MSGATFSAPTTATGGLQNYDLDPRVKNLAPETSTLLRRLRHAAARRRRLRGTMRKDHTTMSDMQSMVGTLRKSVSDIIAAGTDDRDQLLGRSFDEFLAALNKTVEADLQKAVASELQKRGPVEEPLYKGLGTVSRVANLVSTIARQVGLIKDGKDYAGQTKDADADDDSASEEVAALLDHALHAAELAMRQAVNEHVDVAEDGDTDDNQPDGVHLMVVKSADGADLRVKTALPVDLAKFATDPALIEGALLDNALGVLVSAGVPEEALGKLFDEDGAPLAKDAASNTAGGDVGGGGASSVDNGNGDGTDGAGADDQDPVEMLSVLGRLLAASMIQLNGIMNLVEGGDAGDAGAGAGGDAGAGAAVPAGGAAGGGAQGGGDAANASHSADGKNAGQPVAAAGGGSADEEKDKKKPPFAKSADGATDPRVDALQKQMGTIEGLLQKVLQHPEAPKALLNAAGGGVLQKTADTGGEEEPSDTEIAERLDKLSPNARGEAMIKMVQGRSPSAVLKAAGV